MRLLLQARPRRAALVLALASALVLMAAAPAAAAEGEADRALLGMGCTNGKRDGLETGTDCGGPKCPPCGPGKECKSNKDCQSNQCLGRVCAFGPTCNNGIKDADESDVDCGGIVSGCLPCCWSKTCTLNSDCQSGACEAGRCAEAKYCASRFLYDNLGVNAELRTFDGKVADLHQHQQPIKCGQCVCKDCPLNTLSFSLLTAGPCNSTETQALIAQLAADYATRGDTTVTIFCDDTPASTTGRRRLLLTAPVVEVYGSICSEDPTAAIIQGQKTGELRGSCVPEIERAPSPPMP